MTPVTRECHKCHQLLPLDMFSPAKENKGGLSWWCKPCFAQYNRERAVYDPQKRRERYQQKEVEWHRNRYIQHRDEIRQQHKLYVQSPAGQATSKAKKARRLERERNVPNTLTKDDWLRVVSLYAPDGKCLACGKKSKLTLDHILPIALGGETSIFNVQPLCVSCNCSKRASHIDYRPDHGERLSL